VKTNVYIDGFNLYYGAVRGTPYKWLNLREVCERLLPKHEIMRIRYFTALVNGTPRHSTDSQSTTARSYPTRFECHERSADPARAATSP